MGSVDVFHSEKLFASKNKKKLHESSIEKAPPSHKENTVWNRRKPIWYSFYSKSFIFVSYNYSRGITVNFVFFIIIFPALLYVNIIFWLDVRHINSDKRLRDWHDNPKIFSYARHFIPVDPVFRLPGLTFLFYIVIGSPLVCRFAEGLNTVFNTVKQ